jgi:hypothetical protein
VCAILASRDHLVVKLWKIGKEKYMDREAQYEAYCNDRSVKEIMEDELDSICDRLMSPGSEAADEQDKGRAESLCWAIALIENPYAPDMVRVKGRMMIRYERRLKAALEIDAESNEPEPETAEAMEIA